MYVGGSSESNAANGDCAGGSNESGTTNRVFTSEAQNAPYFVVGDPRRKPITKLSVEFSLHDFHLLKRQLGIYH